MNEPSGSRRTELLTIFALMAILLPLSGCVEPDTGDDLTPTILMSIPSLTPRNDGTGEVHDATFTVTKVTPRDADLKWSDIKVLIKAADGSVLLPRTAVREDTGTYGSTVEVWYSDTTGKRSQVDAGDSILITGMKASEYQGGWVYLYHKEYRTSDSTLPTDFP